MTRDRNRLTAPRRSSVRSRACSTTTRARALSSASSSRGWGLDRLVKAIPKKTFFPDYDVSLRDAMTREPDLFSP